AAVDEKQLIAQCRSALSVEPHNGYLAYFLGETYARRGEPDMAMAVWQRTAWLTPTWNAPAVRLVDAMIAKGNPDDAFRVATLVARRSHSAGAAITLARA